ncbi:hypothetical protein [Parendozoicomonas haliclonae]|uniref:Uncharacterized protein n=1 Tax=Parendozoicomonas haliclonae TaxID=1960125 RepID=A0A1X7AS42_9GAMM|nr:hypothetical protein [Parendozoicomonas haliclonae]SMA50963.1 hypothetical protein EHSB41UT_04784 [Parendozoicomonas haliclonae]
MAFFEIISIASGFCGITGVTLKTLSKTKYKREVKGYIADLETRKVLWAEFDLEIKRPVIKSMEEILHNTRELLQVCSQDKDLNKILKGIIGSIGKEIHNIHSYDDRTKEGQYKFFMSIQKFRTDMARYLSALCSSLRIEPSSTELRSLIINMATVRPRT